MRRALVAATGVLWFTALTGGCDGSPTGSPQSAALPGDTSNERRLTHSKSVELVDWATVFRRCMLARGTALGELAKSPTHLSMAVPDGLTAAGVLEGMTACGDKQGGPPANTSLQYREGQILLYLPKRCLLDKRVLST